MSKPALGAWVPFLFGKLPAHGDFVGRGLTASAEAAWDQWGQSSLSSARDTLQEAFAEAHDGARTILFICGPSPRAEGWCCGAIAASIDSVGRRFMVVIGVQGLSSEEAIFLGAGMAELGEAAIRAALMQRLTADEAVDIVARSLPQCHREAAASLELDVATFGLWWRTDGGDIDKGVDSPPRLVATPLVPSPASETVAS